MYKGYKIAAVVPAHNEANQIKEVIVTMPDIVDIIAITDDVSSDDTASIAEATGDDRVIVTRHKKNTGVGGAIISSHAVAISKGSQINVVFAGDGQMDPDYLTQLLDPIVEGKYGYAKGTRLFSKNSHAGMPKYRIFGNYALSYIHKAISGYWHINDPQNGYTAVTADVLKTIDYEKLSIGYEFENDILSKMNEYKIPVIDINIPARYRDEVSGIKLSKVIPALLKNFATSYTKRIFRRYIKKFSVIPVVCVGAFSFGVVSSVFGVVSLGLGAFVFGVLAIVLSIILLSLFDYSQEPKPWNSTNKSV